LLQAFSGKFANGVNDIDGKFATGVVDTGVIDIHKLNRWQIMGTISDYYNLKVNLKVKIYLYVNSTTQRCPNKTIKTVMIEDFSICACVNDSGGAP
jgi:hypothetical protein